MPVKFCPEEESLIEVEPELTVIVWAGGVALSIMTASIETKAIANMAAKARTS